MAGGVMTYLEKARTRAAACLKYEQQLDFDLAFAISRPTKAQILEWYPDAPRELRKAELIEWLAKRALQPNEAHP